MLCEATFQPRTDVMERSELERELERLHPESWGWALACCARDAELAEEALQTAYLRVLSGRATFRGGSSVKTWMFGVIRVTAMEETRRRGFRRARDTGDDAAIDVADPAPGPDLVAERLERSNALIAALAGVSPRQREVLQLVFYHDMTIEDAASVMKVSLGSARTHYDRGKKAMARALARTVER
jgi:RNA polymerase sigma factor (sigma-70 family)